MVTLGIIIWVETAQAVLAYFVNQLAIVFCTFNLLPCILFRKKDTKEALTFCFQKRKIEFKKA